MDYVNTIITGSNANAIFGDDNSPLGSLTLGATLRFIALNHHQGDVETIKPIKIAASEFYTGNNGNYYAQRTKALGVELFILTAPRGAQLPIINEDGWISLDTPPYPIAPYLTTASETRVYTNPDINATVIFVRQATERWIDLLCSSLFRVLPWRFDGTIDETETSLFRAISKGNAEKFNNIINTLCAKYDFQAARFKKILIGWNDGYRQRQIKQLMDECESCHNSIAARQEEIADLYCSLEQYNVNLLALQAQTQNAADDSVYKFFTSHKQISICKTQKCNDGNVMEYCVTDTIEYYDADAFLRSYNTRGSIICEAPEHIKDILYGVFTENKGTFRVEALFKLTNLASISPIRDRTSGQFTNTHIPQPHLYHYGCLGSNEQYIHKYLREGNWDMAIEQTIAAVKNINFGDSVVLSRFISDLVYAYEGTCKCIIADNGKEMNLKEFLSYIRENKNEGVENG